MSYVVKLTASLGTGPFQETTSLDWTTVPESFPFVGAIHTVHSPATQAEQPQPPEHAAHPAKQIQRVRLHRDNAEKLKQDAVGRMPENWLRQQKLPPEPVPAELAGPRIAALYRRVSTALQKDSSMDRQGGGGVEQYAHRVNAKILYVYDDKGKSGRFKAGRKELLQMMKDAEAKKFDLVILETGNRLARDLGLTTSVFRDLRKWGVEIHTPAEGKWHLLHAAFNGVMGQEALENLKMWTRAGMERAVVDGKFPGKPPYGYYKMPGIVGELFEDEKQSEHVIWMYRLRAAGVLPPEIRRLLNAKGVKGQTGGKWSTTMVRQVLRNPIYIGLLFWFRTKSEKIETEAYTIVTKVEKTPMSKWRMAERPDWAFVELQLWNKVQQLSSTNAQRTRSAKRLLSCMMVCARCGSRMHSVSRREGHVRVWCSDRFDRADDRKSEVSTPACNSPSVLMQCVEIVTIKAVAERLSVIGAQAAAEAAYKKAAMAEIKDPVAERRRLDAQILDINMKLAATFDSAYTGDMPNSAIVLKRRELNAELEAAELELAAVPVVALPHDVFDAEGFGDLAAFLDDFPYIKDFDGADEREIRMVALFQELVGKISIDVISPRSCNIEIHGPVAHIGVDDSNPAPVIRVEARDVKLKVRELDYTYDRKWRQVSIPDIKITDAEWELLAPSLPGEPIWIEGYPKPIELRHALDLYLLHQHSNMGWHHLHTAQYVAKHWDHPIEIVHAAIELARYWNVMTLFLELAAERTPRLLTVVTKRLRGRRSGDIDDIPAAFDRRNQLKKGRALDPDAVLSLPKRYGLASTLM